MVKMSTIEILITLSIPEEYLERLQAVSPRVKLHTIPTHDPQDIPQELLAEIEILYTTDVFPDPADVPNLRWIQLHFAGVDHVVDRALFREEIDITTLSGVAASGVAEYALMGILALGRRVPRMMADMKQKRWPENRFKLYQPLALRGSTVGIVGYGSIGREVARLCRAHGATVLAAKHNLKQLDDKDYILEGLGDPHADIPERIYPFQAVGSMASLCDFLVINVPLTPESRGLINDKVFSKMKTGAYLVDVSRGGVVDHGALIEALQSGRLAGAALDVYPLEPLPERSPLWEMQNVILSPHIAGASANYYSQAMDLFAENLKRYLAKKPLLNRYDPARGY